MEGLRSLYFGASRKGSTNLGNLEPCDGMVALRDKLTPESVAWVCIAVSNSPVVELILDLVDVTLSE